MRKHCPALVYCSLSKFLRPRERTSPHPFLGACLQNSAAIAFHRLSIASIASLRHTSPGAPSTLHSVRRTSGRPPRHQWTPATSPVDVCHVTCGHLPCHPWTPSTSSVDACHVTCGRPPRHLWTPATSPVDACHVTSGRLPRHLWTPATSAGGRPPRHQRTPATSPVDARLSWKDARPLPSAPRRLWRAGGVCGAVRRLWRVAPEAVEAAAARSDQVWADGERRAAALWV